MNAWSRLVALFSTQEHPRALALFRIALGLCGIYTLATVMLHGVVDDVWMDVADGGYRTLKRGNFLVEWLGGTSPKMVWGMSIAALVSAMPAWCTDADQPFGAPAFGERGPPQCCAPKGPITSAPARPRGGLRWETPILGNRPSQATPVGSIGESSIW